MNERRGNFKQTISGGVYWPADPRADEVHLFDIAYALSMTCRYGGHCDRWYSVAEHSVLVSYVVPPEHALTGLLHDAPEAYLGDITPQIKDALGQVYYDLEDLNWRVVAHRFNLPIEMHPSVEAADKAVLLAEQAAIMKPPPLPWGVKGEPAKVPIKCLKQEAAFELFVARFADLMTGRA